MQTASDKIGFLKDDENIEHYHDKNIFHLVTKIVAITGVTYDQFWEIFGDFYIDYLCNHGWNELLRSMSPDFMNFFSELNSLHYFISFATYKNTTRRPSFRCEKCEDGSILLHYYSSQRGIHPILKGAVRKVAKNFFGIEVKITLIELSKCNVQYADSLYEQEHAVYKIENINQYGLLWTESKEVKNENDAILQVNKMDFNSLQPYHFIADRNCTLIQCGKGLYQHISMKLLAPGTPLDRIFDIIWPQISFDFDRIHNFINAMFVLQLKTVMNNKQLNSIRTRRNQTKSLKLKGQMIILEQKNRLLYIGSPDLNTISELFEYGIRLEAMPLHDFTRDLILLNQQRLSNIEKNMQLQATSTEMEKQTRDVKCEHVETEALLYQLLPTFVATQLINGKKMAACEFLEFKSLNSGEYQEVTVMFSDIQNFNTIVVGYKPEQVIKLLNELFIKLDRLVEKHSVVKIETTDDTYVTVGGIPEQTNNHCEILCYVALGMIFETRSIIDPITEKPLQLRFGINSGPIVAGVIGKKMPRYCLFGDTVNTASRMTTHGVAGKIHCSKSSFECAQRTGKFIFEYRGKMKIKNKGAMETYFLKSSIKKSIWEITGIERNVDKHSIDGYAELEKGLEQKEAKNCQVCTML
uniref:guanylate cyclase n=1 Tax=Onchocerca volvulus TaxID=6282 RepID=A0A8R1TK96_ONCVO